MMRSISTNTHTQNIRLILKALDKPSKRDRGESHSSFEGIAQKYLLHFAHNADVMRFNREQGWGYADGLLGGSSEAQWLQYTEHAAKVFFQANVLPPSIDNPGALVAYLDNQPGRENLVPFGEETPNRRLAWKFGSKALGVVDLVRDILAEDSDHCIVVFTSDPEYVAFVEGALKAGGVRAGKLGSKVHTFR